MARRQLPTLSPRFEPTPIYTNIFHRRDRRERGDELKIEMQKPERKMATGMTEMFLFRF